MQGIIPELRCDRFELRRPVVRDDGTTIFEGVLVCVDDPLQYRWGTEYPSFQALSDPEYLEGLRGLSLLFQHPPDEEIKGEAPREGNGRRAGSVLNARFDPNINGVIVEMAVHEARDAELVRKKLGQLSEGYTPVVLPDDMGVLRQIKRRPNHVAFTELGRAKSSEVRTDSMWGTDMEELLKALMAKIDELSAKVAALMPSEPVVDSAPAMDEQVGAAVEKELGKGARLDSAAFYSALDARVTREAAAIVELRRRADSLGVTVDASVNTQKGLAKALALALGGDAKRVDSVDYCDGIIAAAKPSVTQGTTNRNDATDTEEYAI